ncbi:MAG: methyltransferase, partial [Mesorhizobium sp.]
MTAALHPAEPALATDRARRGGRAGKRAGGSAAFEQPPFRQLKNPLTPTRLVSDDELESIHLASLRVLKEIGVDVLHEEARRIM